LGLRGRDGHITSGIVTHRNDRWQGGGMRFLRFAMLTEIKHASDGLDQVVFEEVRRHAGTDAAHLFGDGSDPDRLVRAPRHSLRGRPGRHHQAVRHGKVNAEKAAMVAAMKARGFPPR